MIFIYACTHSHTHTCTSYLAALGAAAAVSQENLPGINFSADPLGAQPKPKTQATNWLGFVCTNASEPVSTKRISATT